MMADETTDSDGTTTQTGDGTQTVDPNAGGGNETTGGYYPEGLQDSMRGSTDQETIDRLFNGYKTMREKESARGSVPKEPGAYALPDLDSIDETVRPYLAELDNDPIYGKIQEVFHANGVTDAQFQKIVPAFYQQLIDADLMEPIIDPVAERKQMVPDELANASVEDQGKAVEARLQENEGFLATFGEGENGLDKDAIEAAKMGLLDTAAGNRFIETVRKALGGSVNPITDGQGVGGMTKADLEKRAADPRNKTDKRFSAETDRLYEQFYGE
jgi:hypothetical protein